jgi:hypothetical protein
MRGGWFAPGWVSAEVLTEEPRDDRVEPVAGAGAARGEAAARVTLSAKRPRGGDTVFESPPADLGASPQPQHVSFDVTPGPIELRITVADREGQTIDRETRAIDVPDYPIGSAGLGTPQFYRARTPREFQALAADTQAIPMATRDFSRTDRVLIRFDAYAPEGEPSLPGAAILSRAGRRMFDVPVTRSTGACIRST